MNLRPLDPQSSAIPNFATPGYRALLKSLRYTTTHCDGMQVKNEKTGKFFSWGRKTAHRRPVGCPAMRKKREGGVVILDDKDRIPYLRGK